MKLQPASRRELKHIAVGTLICSAVMVAIFVLLSVTGIYPSVFWQVLLSALLGKLLVLLGSDYRYLFLFGTVTTALGACCLWVVYRHFLRLGGDRAYQAPDPDRP